LETHRERRTWTPFRGRYNQDNQDLVFQKNRKATHILLFALIYQVISAKVKKAQS
jgi:hypothetical protein